MITAKIEKAAWVLGPTGIDGVAAVGACASTLLVADPRKESQGRLSDIIENIPGYVFQRVRKPDGAIEYPYISPSFGRLIGQDPSIPLKGEDLWANMHPDDRGKLRASVDQCSKTLCKSAAVFRLTPKNARETWIRAYSTARHGGNGDVVWDCVAVDITAEKENEVRLAYLAHHDPLTGLANRVLLADRLTSDIKAEHINCPRIAVSQLSLIGFTEINETLGVDDGDAVLKSVGARMSDLALLHSGAVVARIGNAEFAILRHGATAGAELDEFVSALIQIVAQPIQIGADSVAVEPCVGTAVFEIDDLRHLAADRAAQEVLKRGAIALSAAAKAGQAPTDSMTRSLIIERATA